MADAVINVYGGDYEHTLGLPGFYKGYDVRYMARPVLEIFDAVLNRRAYEVAEFSLASYIILRTRGAEWLLAVPIFPYRAFRHSTLFVRRDSQLQSPRDLLGKRVGVPDYSMTAAVWTRGILLEQYDVHWSGIRWVTNGNPRFADLMPTPTELSDRDLEADVLDGRLDALLIPSTRDEAGAVNKRQLRPLIKDVRRVEKEYFTTTGIYPINHVVTVRTDVLDSHPDLPDMLFEAYVRAKLCAYERRLGATLIPWGQRSWRDIFDQFGGDPLPYGLTQINRSIVEKLVGFLFEQKLITRRITVEELFAKESLNLCE